MDPMLPWLLAGLRARVGNQRGQAEAIVLALIILLLWLIATGRRVIVQ